jgi:NAD+ synthase
MTSFQIPEKVLPMSSTKSFSKDTLKITDIELLVNNIVSQMKNDILITLHKSGGVVGISGGIDSSVTFALAVRALGPEKVIGIMLPERDSNSESKTLAIKLGEKLSAQVIEENITNALEGFDCYKRRDEAVAKVFPEYDPITYKMKIGINKTGINQNLPPLFTLSIIDPNGKEKSQFIPVKEYLQIVASSNFKQRCRMSMLYYHAEANNYAVIGTPNKHEVEQGFFVKYGDGGADLMPIAHLYKSQVYQLAEYLGIPQEIIDRTPTTDTYTAEQTQEEFFFQLPYQELDLIWYAFENNIEPHEVGSVVNKTADEIQLIYKNFSRKQKTTEYLRMQPIKY